MNDKTPRPLEASLAARLKALAALGVLAFVVGLRLWPERAWADLLVANVLLTTLSLGAVVFVASQHLSAATWSVALRRVFEAMFSYLPLGALLSAALLLGARFLYPWAGPGGAALSKGGYLTVLGLGARAAFCWASWLVLSRRLAARADRASSAVFLLAFAPTFTLFSVDWLMSLEPRWTSTLYAWYVFAGAFSGGLAAATALLLWVRRRGALGAVNEHHLHDLGKCVFAFSCFWAYLWFSQGLLIWYSNLPEETSYYVHRMTGGWAVLFWLNPVLNFVVPFTLLLSARAKKSRQVLFAACVVVLAGRWLDLYVLVMPGIAGASAQFAVADLAICAGLSAAALLLFDRAFRHGV